jgi:predicted  nucleic acid-binding Zn-ribbon protein
MRPAAIRDQGPHICPTCGERVSAFAAGCSICGADLDPRRAQRRRSAQSRLREALREKGRRRRSRR